MLTLHHLNNSRSHRIMWLLEELGLEYEIKKYQRNKKTMLAPDSLKKIHPLGKSPVLQDGDYVLAESAAILEYLLAKYASGKFAPVVDPESANWRRYRYWMHYAEGSLMPPLLLSLVFSKFATSPTPLPLRPVGLVISTGFHKGFIGPEITKHLRFINDELGKSQWFAGDDFGAADIQMSYPLIAAASRVDLAEFQNIQSYLDAIKARPAYAKAIDKGGEFDF